MVSWEPSMCAFSYKQDAFLGAHKDSTVAGGGGEEYNTRGRLPAFRSLLPCGLPRPQTLNPEL